MQATYQEAINQVFKDEGGYSNDAGDPGGPTNWGITIEDARHYWKSDATAEDVKNMPKSVAEDIYVKHYATPLQYNSLPAGVDYAVLDYGINSGISRSAKVLQELVGVTTDGQIGPLTLAEVTKKDPAELINAIYDERLRFLQGLSTWHIFGRGWTSRCTSGRALALKIVQEYKGKAPITPLTRATIPSHVGTAAVVVTGTATAAAASHGMSMWHIGIGIAIAAVIIGILVELYWKRINKNVVVAQS